MPTGRKRDDAARERHVASLAGIECRKGPRRALPVDATPVGQGRAPRTAHTVAGQLPVGDVDVGHILQIRIVVERRIDGHFTGAHRRVEARQVGALVKEFRRVENRIDDRFLDSLEERRKVGGGELGGALERARAYFEP